MKPFDSLITFFYTRDLEKTHHFYHRVLDLPMVLDQGQCRIYRVSRSAYVGFCLDAGKTPNESVMITLVTDDVDLWFRKVMEAGGEVISPPGFNPRYNIHHCFVKDPSGYTVEIQRFEDPRWKRE